MESENSDGGGGGGGAALVPLTTLAVKVCRTTSASVIRGPTSLTGRQTPLSFLKVEAKKRLEFKEIVEKSRPLERGVTFQQTKMNMMRRDNFCFINQETWQSVEGVG